MTCLLSFHQQLTKALEKHHPGRWEVNPGDGAFYGPKIDITIRDALRRSFQCATIQLDFTLPERFNLKYRAPEDTNNPDRPPSRPVIIHRALLGSFERFIAIITEHLAGKWCVSPEMKGYYHGPLTLHLKAFLAIPASSSCHPRSEPIRKHPMHSHQSGACVGLLTYDENDRKITRRK